MRFGVFGKGRLGSAVARRLGERSAWNVAREAPPDGKVDAAIEVSSGHAVESRLAWAISTKTPLVIGSTGWNIPDLSARVGDRIGVLVAPNFSLSVALAVQLTRILGRFAAMSEARDPYILEHHHAKKKDAPSGTAKLLAETMIDACPRKKSWAIAHPESPTISPDVLNVASIRAGHTYSSHVIGVDAPGEVLEIHHQSRDVSPYADGAVAALEWIAHRRGLFSIEDWTRDALAPLFSGVLS